MSRVQFITTPGGEELAVLTRADYDLLAAAAGDEAAEDAAASRLVERSLERLARGEDLVLPADVSDAIAVGENPVRVVRKWRRLTQAALAERIGVEQGYISAIENNAKRGNPGLFRKLADALGVPLDLLVP